VLEKVSANDILLNVPTQVKAPGGAAQSHRIRLRNRRPGFESRKGIRFLGSHGIAGVYDGVKMQRMCAEKKGIGPKIFVNIYIYIYIYICTYIYVLVVSDIFCHLQTFQTLKLCFIRNRLASGSESLYKKPKVSLSNWHLYSLDSRSVAASVSLAL
jgi:hypothetical protein